MAKPKVEHIQIARYTYRVWSRATPDQVQAVEGVAAVVEQRAGVYVVTLGPRYDAGEVLAEIEQVGAGRRESGG